MPAMKFLRRFILVLTISAGGAAPAKAWNILEAIFGAQPAAAPQAVAPDAGADKARQKQDAARRKAAQIAALRQQEAARVAMLAHALERAKLPVPPCCLSSEQAIGLMMADATLRPGDVYASTEGLRVFVGAANSPHRREDFVPLAQARSLNPGLRARLASASAPDLRRAAVNSDAAAAKGGDEPPTLVVHAASAPRPENRIVESDGRRIRFVGGAAPQN